MANETPAQGSQLRVDITAVATAIANQVSFSGPEGTKAEIDLTNLVSSVATGTVGIVRWNRIRLTGNLAHSEASQAYLISSFKTAAPKLEAWSILYADAGAAVVAFSGYISELAFGEAAVDGLVTFSMTVSITGDITVTP